MNKILILGVLLLLSSCNTEKQLAKAINRHGQKESCAYFVFKYPEYFKQATVHDTVVIVDSVKAVIPDYVHDTTVVFDSTYMHESDRLKLEIIRLGKKLSIKAKCKGDTVYVPYIKTVPVSVECPPCPDISVLESKETFIQKAYKIWSWISIGLLVPMACLGALIYYTRTNKPNNGTNSNS